MSDNSWKSGLSFENLATFFELSLAQPEIVEVSPLHNELILLRARFQAIATDIRRRTRNVIEIEPRQNELLANLLHTIDAYQAHFELIGPLFLQVLQERVPQWELSIPLLQPYQQIWATHPRIHVAPDLPDIPLQKAMQTYVQHPGLSTRDILLFVNESYWISKPAGLVLTQEMIYGRELGRSPVSKPLKEIREVSVLEKRPFMRMDIIFNGETFYNIGDAIKQSQRQQLGQALINLIHFLNSSTL